MIWLRLRIRTLLAHITFFLTKKIYFLYIYIYITRLTNSKAYFFDYAGYRKMIGFRRKK